MLGKPLTTYKGATANAWLQTAHSAAITCIAQDNENIYTGSEDNTAIVWSKTTGQIKQNSDAFGAKYPVGMSSQLTGPYTNALDVCKVVMRGHSNWITCLFIRSSTSHNWENKSIFMPQKDPSANKWKGPSKDRGTTLFTGA
jgi:WD40 repeat protein